MCCSCGCIQREVTPKADPYWDTCEEKLLNALSLLVDWESDENKRLDEMISILKMKPQKIKNLFDSLPSDAPAYEAFETFRGMNPRVFQTVVLGLRIRLQEKAHSANC